MTDPQALAEDAAIVGDMEKAAEDLARVRNETSRIILGQQEVIALALTAILAGGHALLVGVPGLAKTLLVTTLGTVLGLDEKRIQFTPDLMPADIIGSEVMEEDEHGRRHFRFIPGPVFAQLLMADEINRASPRTQSALLQAMQERYVTVAGQRHDLPRPFHVLATQNPLEQEGTYPLPEAQLDRFLLEIDVRYPDREAEKAMLIATTGAEQTEPHRVLTAERLMRIQHLVRLMPVAEHVLNAILDVVRAARPGTEEADPFVNETVAWGPGPRAAQALMLGARARALLHGRFSPSLEDVAALLDPVLRHRMAVTFSARADGITVEDVIAKLKERLA
ncbi:MoxR family ATPase [Thermopetrobacter sp. TC1]|uniref:AAA family ATPase n=1 Tax=Thermopetrobacter sp. TC1 TaxID=1495045 RepID=UPI000570F3ED|nr:MoxR family ATPase [Thermopetrobacter sp. TC1]